MPNLVDTINNIGENTVGADQIVNGSIVNTDISGSAAIEHSKLQNITAGSVLMGNATNVATETVISGDVTVSSSGVTAIGAGVIVDADINGAAAIDKTKISGTAITAADTGTVTSTMIANGTIVNADISASAAISLSKLATSSPNNIIVYNASGVPTSVALSGDITISSVGEVSIAPNSVELGTDTFGNYVADVTAGTGVTVVDAGEVGISGEASSLTISIGQSVATDANPSFAGATLDAVQIGITAAGEIDTTSGDLVIDSAGGTVTIDDNLIVSGNFTVSGTTTTLNTQTLNVSDNILVLNNDVTGSPTENSGIEIERGTSPNVDLRWNETNDKWELTNDGTNYGNIVTTADSGAITSTMILDGTIVNADINASAAIEHSKLANITAGQVLLGNASNVPTATALSGDVTVNSSGVTAIGSGVIVNADISSSAAIEQGKIADVTIDTKTATYTLVLTDKNKFIEMNVASANDVTVPTNANVAFPIGSQIHITQYGAGKTRIVAQTPATTTVRATPGVFLRAQYASATLIKRGTDEWYLVGDLSAT